MSYRCQTCGEEWPDQLAAKNGYSCTLTCRGTLVRFVPSSEPPPLPEPPLLAPVPSLLPVLPATDCLPYPSALAVERLRASIARPDSAWDQASRHKDALEALVKGLCVYGLGAYLVHPGRTPESDETLLDLLVRPSTGDWVALLGVLAKMLRDEPPPSRDLYRLLFKRSGNKDEATAHYQALLDYVPFRNSNFGHGSRRSDAEYVEKLRRFLPQLSALIDGLGFLRDHPLVKPLPDGTAEIWSGPESGRIVAGPSPAPEAGHIGFVAAGGRFVNVEPFFLFLDCEECSARRAFFYESQRSYGRTESKKSLYMHEYEGGHRPHFHDPVSLLEDRFTKELLLRVYHAFRLKMVAIEKYLKDFGWLVEMHAEIVGRQFVRDRVKRFLDTRQSGVFLITGEPGIGKTAIMGNLVETELAGADEVEVGRLAFFYRHASAQRSPDDFVQCLLQSLLARHQLALEDAATDPKGRRAQLQNLLAKISGLLKPGEKQVIIVDGLDEAGRAFDDASAVEVLPHPLPPNIYFVVSSRPQLPDLHDLARRGDVERFDLKADSAENQEDAVAYVQEKLAGRCDAGTQRRIAERAEWNFLFLKLICEAVATDNYSPEEIDEILSRNVGLKGWYASDWNRLEKRFEDRPERMERISAVLGAIAAAGSPVTRDQVCESLKLSPARFDWALRFIGQYLDVIPITSEGVGHRGPTELVLYRIFHFSFREFVLERVHPDLAAYHAQWGDLLADWRDLEGHELDYALRNLPRHLLQGRRAAELATIFTDLDFIEAKCAAGQTYDLVADYGAALATAGMEWPVRAEVVDFYHFVRGHAHLLASRPELTFQQAANEPDETAPAKVARQRVESGAEKRPWLRWVNKPQKRNACLLTFAGRNSKVQCHGFSPDGRFVAIGYADGTLMLWNADTGHEMHTLAGHKDAVTVFAFSPDSARLLTGSSDHTMKMWDVPTGAEILSINHGAPVQSCAFVARGTWLASVSTKETVKLWDAQTGAELPQHAWRLRITRREWTVWGVQLVIAIFIGGCALKAIGEGDADKRMAIMVIVFFAAFVREFCPRTSGQPGGFSPDGQKFAWRFNRGFVKIYDTVSGAELARVKGGQLGCAFAPDSARIALLREKEKPLMRDLAAGQNRPAEMSELTGFTAVGAPALDVPGRKRLLPLGNGSVQLWDGTAAPTAEAKPGWPIQTCRFSPDGEAIITSRLSGIPPSHHVTVWDGVTGALRFTPPSLAGLRAWSFIANGRQLAAELGRHRLTFWNLADGTRSTLRALPGQMPRFPAGHVRQCFWLSTIVTPMIAGIPLLLMIFAIIFGSNTGPLIGWTIAGLIGMWLFVGLALSVIFIGQYWLGPHGSACVSSPDGKCLASQRSDGWVRIWDVTSGRFVARNDPEKWAPGLFSDMLYSPDGRELLLLSETGLALWDAATATPRIAAERPLKTERRFGDLWRRIFGGGGWVKRSGKKLRSFAFSPDGTQIVLLTENGELSFRDSKTLEEQAVCAGITGVVPAGLVAPDGRRTAVGETDGTVRVREVPSGRELAAFQGHRAAVNGCEFSPDATFLASVSADFTLWVRTAEDGGRVTVFHGPSPLTAVGWHPEGRSLAVGDAQGQLYLLRLENAAAPLPSAGPVAK